jgi:hypothetical protein
MACVRTNLTFNKTAFVNTHRVRRMAWAGRARLFESSGSKTTTATTN